MALIECGALAIPLAAGAQRSAKYRIGLLAPVPCTQEARDPATRELLEAFPEGLRSQSVGNISTLRRRAHRGVAAGPLT